MVSNDKIFNFKIDMNTTKFKCHYVIFLLKNDSFNINWHRVSGDVTSTCPDLTAMFSWDSANR